MTAQGWNTIKTILKATILFSLAIVIVCYFKKDDLPHRAVIDDSLFREPVQNAIDTEPFIRTSDGYSYEITPKYDYELYGLVVSQHSTDTWTDISHEYDTLNTKDICVIWGANLESDLYRYVKYWSGDFTCYYQYGGSAAARGTFDGNALSNNHLLPANEVLSEEIGKASVGDQIHITGMLVDYSTTGPQGTSGKRTTSTTRTDTGCEIIYTTAFEIIEKGNVVYHMAYSIALSVFIASLASLIYITFFRFK
jgi:hypothetical protein